jgi:hypothetical protein
MAGHLVNPQDFPYTNRMSHPLFTQSTIEASSSAKPFRASFFLEQSKLGLELVQALKDLQCILVEANSLCRH